MKKSMVPVMSIDEMVATIRRSSLPTLIIEGKDDVVALRHLEKKFSAQRLSVFPAGGRANVLNLFDRRGEFPQDTFVAFIVDQDTWVHSGVPEQYVSDTLLTTSGYSIENDLYCDGEMESLLSNVELSKFRAELERFVRWYALAVFRYLKAPEGGILNTHPNEILDNATRFGDRTRLEDGEAYPDQLYLAIIENYKLMVRGKSLIWILMRHLSYPGRLVRHNGSALIEVAALRGGVFMQRIYAKLGSLLGAAVDVEGAA